MPKGGSRVGSGPKRGGKRVNAGRKFGSVEKIRTTAEIVKEFKGKKQLPLHYMLRIMNDPNADTVRRDQMAVASAGYCHAKLTAQAVISETKVTYVARLPSPVQDLEDWERQTKLLLKPH